MNQIVLAADLGGTNMRMAAVDADGSILAHARTATPRDDANALLTAMSGLADECRNAVGDKRIVGIGVGVPANFDAEGILANLPNLRAFREAHIARDTRE